MYCKTNNVSERCLLIKRCLQTNDITSASMLNIVSSLYELTVSLIINYIILYIMEFETAKQNNYNKHKYITEEDVKLIVSKFVAANEDDFIENYDIRNASDKMLGFLCDYWKIQVNLGPHNRMLRYFVKAKSVTNAAKAEMVKELRLFDKELYFYREIKQSIEIPDLRSWSAGFVTGLENAMVFEDLNALQYKLRDKFKRFDMAHALEALRTLTRFHASSIVYEEKKSEELGRRFSLTEKFSGHLHETGYIDTANWFVLCSKAGLDAIKQFSNYTQKEIETIENRWYNVWSSGLALSNASTEHRSVICHRDLWNNNLMFHYKTVGENTIPDDCVLVDFQAAKYQPPAGDVMLLLYCNLDPKFREDNLKIFLDFYYDELDRILIHNRVETASIVKRDEFFESAEKQRQWATVVCACLIPQFWVDEDLTTEIFCDTAQFDDILTKNKSAFVMKMMQSNPDYKEKVMNVFEEIAERYCL